MARYFLDTSGLVKHYHAEAGTARVDEILREPVPGVDGKPEADFRFTKDGWGRREELLAEAEDRIERERFEPPDVSNLSESARDLLRRIVSGDQVEVNKTNLPAYRELAAARIMMPLHSFIGGWESAFLGTILGFVLFALSGMTGGMGIKVTNGEWSRIRFEFMWWSCFCFWTTIGVLIVAYADLPISWKKRPTKVPESRKK